MSMSTNEDYANILQTHTYSRALAAHAHARRTLSIASCSGAMPSSAQSSSSRKERSCASAQPSSRSAPSYLHTRARVVERAPRRGHPTIAHTCAEETWTHWVSDASWSTAERESNVAEGVDVAGLVVTSACWLGFRKADFRAAMSPVLIPAMTNTVRAPHLSVICLHAPNAVYALRAHLSP